MDLFQAFAAVPAASSAVDFSAVPLPGARADFLAKSQDGGPVFLLEDSSPASYSPAIELANLSVQFHNTCRVATDKGSLDGQFAVISCDASTRDLHEIFVRCIAAAAEQLPLSASTADLRRCVQGLLDLFRALSRPSRREVTGLWAELFLISMCKDVASALRAWHADGFERFDFSWPKGRLEVKAAAREERKHNFALEQLKPPSYGSGYVASVLLQSLNGGVGLIDLANEIEPQVFTAPALRQKLWQNIAETLGSDFSEYLDQRFDPSHAARNLVVFAMSDVPAPEQPRDGRITDLRFRVDLSTVRTSLAVSAQDLLADLFS